MSLSPDQQTELRRLLSLLSDGTLTPSDAQQLNDLLHGNPEACEVYLDHLTLEAHLRSELGGPALTQETLPSFVRSAARTAKRVNLFHRLRRFAPRIVGLAAAVLFGVGLSFLWLPSKPEPSEANPRPGLDCVATLLFADNCQWGGQERFTEGQRLPIGGLQLERGLAVLRFDGGAAVILEGPAELGVETRGSARLTAGRLTVRAPDEAAGFTVHTPASEVVDLGTEFAVVGEKSGATELHVLEGAVTYGKPGAPQEQADLLEAGHAVRYDQIRESPHTVPLHASRFTELIRDAKIGPRQDLLLAHEPFDYPLGRVALADANGGTGWAGPWFVWGNKTPKGDDAELSITAAKLKIAWPVEGGRGPMLEAPPTYQSRARYLAEPVRLDEDGLYYVSVLVRWETPPEPTGPTNTVSSVRLVLRNSTNFNGDRVMFNLPIHQRPQLDIRSGAIFSSATTVTPGETQLWVGKIVARRSGEDEIFFRVYGENEPLDAMEPGVWSVRSRGIASDAKLDLVLLSKFGGGQCWWDEVRIGKSWRAVVPTTLPAKNSK
jgi:ferric-dicitrate binding protein FerR (iron transport regulator)